jgi:prepilin-type N-terminal cleavage/methylation domain-containing protein
MARKTSRGFTLIELMASVAIIGVLSSVAVPNYKLASLRARKAERDVVLDAVNRSMQAILVRQGRFAPTSQGDWNPAGTPTTNRRQFDYGAAGWRDLDLQIQGHLYYSYYFLADEATPRTDPAYLYVFAKGDLDGDGVIQERDTYFKLVEGALLERQPDVFTPDGDVAF